MPSTKPSLNPNSRPSSSARRGVGSSDAPSTYGSVRLGVRLAAAWRPIQGRWSLLLLYLAGLISIVGLTDALYLTITHYTKRLVPCNFTHACETVLNSKYSEVLGVPVAAMGIIFYIVALVLIVHFLWHKTYHWIFFAWTAIGFVSTLYLFYIQAAVLHAFCQYCLLSALTSTTLFIIGAILQIRNQSLKKAGN